MRLCRNTAGQTTMPRRNTMKRTSSLLIVSIVGLLISAGQSWAAPREKVGICHYQEDQGTWKLITVGEPAAMSHTAKHDDAVPGGETSITGTTLDYNCEPTMPSCGTCLSISPNPGCTNVACEAAVGAIDPFCINASWDWICVGEAQTYCVSGGICTP